MTTPQKEPDVSTPSGAYTRMAPRWALIDTLLGGTEAMRAAGKTYLPCHENESRTSYDNRLSRATLVNALEDTLDTLVGRPFSEEITLGADMPTAVADLLTDVDLQGTALQPFCRNWFRESWAKGFSHVLVDFPTQKPLVDAQGNPRPRTLADDRAEGARPYMVHIRPENVLAAYAEMIDGKECLTHVRILETTVEQDGWGERDVHRIKVLERGTWAVYGYDTGHKKWVLEDQGPTGLGRIPLKTFYTGKRSGLMECKPPLTDLAHLNITHWQSSSDQRNVLTVARFPILAAAGVDADAKVIVGPNNFLTTTDPQGKWYYVEHTGAAIEAGAKDLADLENKMAAYGSEFLRAKPGTETATGRAIDSAESTSYLSATVMTFQDALEEVLQYMAEWLKLSDGGSVVIKSDFGEDDADSAEQDILVKMRAGRDISRATLLNEMQRRGVLDEAFDAEADKALLDEEGDIGLGMFNKGNGTGANIPVVPPLGSPAAGAE